MGRKPKSFEDQTIDGMANELARDTVKSMCKDGKLTPQGRSLAKLMDRIMPDEMNFPLILSERRYAMPCFIETILSHPVSTWHFMTTGLKYCRRADW